MNQAERIAIAVAIAITINPSSHDPPKNIKPQTRPYPRITIKPKPTIKAQTKPKNQAMNVGAMKSVNQWIEMDRICILH